MTMSNESPCVVNNSTRMDLIMDVTIEDVLIGGIFQDVGDSAEGLETTTVPKHSPGSWEGGRSCDQTM